MDIRAFLLLMEQQKQTKNKRKRRTVLWIVGMLFVLAGCIAIHYRDVRPIVTMEYGGRAPMASAFTAREATLEMDVVRPNCGWHLLNLKIGGVPTPVLLHVKDTIAPTAEPLDREVALGIPLGPDAFVANLKDADVVELTFLDPPDFQHEGEQP